MPLPTYTISGKIDGFGAQYHAIMSGIAICEYKKYKYIHTPITTIDHGVNVSEINNFIGLKEDKEAANITEKYSAEVHFSPTPSIYYTDKFLRIIRSHYYSVEKPNIDIDIAIHIRRGDVNIENHPSRYTINSSYVKYIDQLKKRYPTYAIKVFSQGVLDDFNDLGLGPECFALNENITTTFHSLVRAKVLVMAKSSLSYSAALLNENTIYYQPFWHKKLKHWINL